eukprot:scaffold4050_cov88-Phaeocystis_antarctica.AAC.4
MARGPCPSADRSRSGRGSLPRALLVPELLGAGCSLLELECRRDGSTELHAAGPVARVEAAGAAVSLSGQESPVGRPRSIL